MADIETLKRQIENRETMFTETDHVMLTQLQKEMGGFSVIRRPDLPRAHADGLMLVRLEVKYDD